MDQVSNPTPAEWALLEQDRLELTPELLAQRFHGGCLPPWHRLLARLTEDCADLLDMGSGTGVESAELSAAGKRVTLLDYSPENLEFSRRFYRLIGQQGRFVRHDLTRRLPFEDGAFDSAFCWSVLQFFDDEVIEGILSEALRVSRKRVIVASPDAFCLPYGLAKWYRSRRGDWPWADERRFRSFKPFLRAAGAKKVRQFSIGAKHGLDFLTMPGARVFRKAAVVAFGLKDNCRRALLRQGYFLVAVGEKDPLACPVVTQRESLTPNYIPCAPGFVPAT